MITHRLRHLFALAVLASLPSIVSANTNQTTTTLTVAGNVKRGQTITVTATVTGLHSIYLVQQSTCNVFDPNTVSITDGNTVITAPWATDQNSTNYKTYLVAPTKTFCPTGYVTNAQTTTVTSAYTIPTNAKSVNLQAKFIIGNDPYTLGSESAVYSAKLSRPPIGAITSVIFGD